MDTFILLLKRSHSDCFRLKTTLSGSRRAGETDYAKEGKPVLKPGPQHFNSDLRVIAQMGYRRAKAKGGITSEVPGS